MIYFKHQLIVTILFIINHRNDMYISHGYTYSDNIYDFFVSYRLGIPTPKWRSNFMAEMEMKWNAAKKKQFS